MANVLVLGATGGIGSHLASRLLSDGWSVRALTRDPERARRSVPGPIDWSAGDALDATAVRQASARAELIVHAVNPPGYRDWDKLVLPLIDNTIEAARQVGARVLLPGTIYNYGPDAFPVVTETSPQNPRSRKGAIRVELERRLEAATARGEIRALIVRAGDFFGPGTGNNWFSGGMIRPGKPVRTVWNPASPGVGHAWAYLPDLAATMATLAARHGDLPSFARFHFAGHWDGTGREMAAAIGRSTGARIRAFPWRFLPLAAPFVPLARELGEMRYLWRVPVRLDNTQLVRTLGKEPRTPLDIAVRDTLRALGCSIRSDGEQRERNERRVEGGGMGSLRQGSPPDLRA